MFLQLSISFVTYEWAQYAKMTGSFAFLQHPKIVFDFVSEFSFWTKLTLSLPRLMFARKAKAHPRVKHLLWQA